VALRDARHGARRIVVVFPVAVMGLAIAGLTANIGAAGHNTALVYGGMMVSSLLSTPGLLYVGILTGRIDVARRWHESLHTTTATPSTTADTREPSRAGGDPRKVSEVHGIVLSAPSSARSTRVPPRAERGNGEASMGTTDRRSTSFVTAAQTMSDEELRAQGEQLFDKLHGAGAGAGAGGEVETGGNPDEAMRTDTTDPGAADRSA